VSFRGRQCTEKIDSANDQKNYRPGAGKSEVATAHLVNEEEQANRDENRGPHQAAGGAAAAGATETVTHRSSSSKILPPKSDY
jgi:hypothetical protein